jgi:hypothetical protein
MEPPENSIPEMEHETIHSAQGEQPPITNRVTVNNISAAAAASSQQQKVVPIAFIHKLYKYVIPHIR